MTSPRKARTRAEQLIFDGLPPSIRAAMNECEASPPRPSVVLEALLRGVNPDAIIQTINKRSQDNG